MKTSEVKQHHKVLALKISDDINKQENTPPWQQLLEGFASVNSVTYIWSSLSFFWFPLFLTNKRLNELSGPLPRPVLDLLWVLKYSRVRHPHRMPISLGRISRLDLNVKGTGWSLTWILPSYKRKRKLSYQSAEWLRSKSLGESFPHGLMTLFVCLFVWSVGKNIRKQNTTNKKQANKEKPGI